MKKMIIVALVVAHPATAASAADLAEVPRAERTRTGAFAGARLRLSLGETRSKPVRAGFTLTPTLHVVRPDGSKELRIGEGLEYGLTGRGTPKLLVAGRPAAALFGNEEVVAGRRKNLSPTAAYVAIGIGILGLAYLAWYASEMNEPRD